MRHFHRAFFVIRDEDHVNPFQDPEVYATRQNAERGVEVMLADMRRAFPDKQLQPMESLEPSTDGGEVRVWTAPLADESVLMAAAVECHEACL